jgi:hypothetical protein
MRDRRRLYPTDFGFSAKSHPLSGRVAEGVGETVATPALPVYWRCATRGGAADPVVPDFTFKLSDLIPTGEDEPAAN